MSQSGRIQIHLTIHQEGEDVRIDFPFDIHNDSINQVVAELNEQCNFTPEEIIDLKQMIEAQIQKKTSAAKSIRNSGNAFEPIQITEEKNSDDEFMDDPEYAALIEQQKKELAALQERHLKEQQELSANGTIPSASPPHKCDDLLLFY